MNTTKTAHTAHHPAEADLHDSALVQAIAAAVIERGAEMVRAIAPSIAIEIAKGLTLQQRDRLYIPPSLTPRGRAVAAMPAIREMAERSMTPREIMRELRLSRSSVYSALAKIRAESPVECD